MMRKTLVPLLLAAGAIAGCRARIADRPATGPGVMKMEEGFVDAGGVLIYYKALGSGPPLLILHGGPGASHDYFLPYLLPLARTNRLVFIDERGSGRSEKLEDPSGYTLENMAEDVEAVRRSLALGKVNLLGHSVGGALAMTYALKYGDRLDHLLLCSTFHSTRLLNDALGRIVAGMSPELRGRVERLERAGLFGHGRAYEQSRYSAEYMVAAWGEGYFPYLYGRRPDPNWDPVATGNMSWDLYRQMWGSHGEFVVDGNLISVEYADRLGSLRVPTLITVGDHDEVDSSISRDMQRHIAGSQLVVLPQSGHMTFVDQPGMFVKAVDAFVHDRR